MRIPFTVEQFLEVFRRYNEAVWPAQWVLYAVALAAVAMLFHDADRAGRAVSGILAALWLWMGAVYHLAFFRSINPAAVLFGGLFIVQAALFAWIGVRRKRLAFDASRRPATVIALLLLAYALVVYPALAHALGHRYPATPTFGLPCPTTIFTLGLLLLARPPLPRALLVVPLLWVVVGTSATVQLGMYEDFGLLAAGLLTVLIAVWRARPRRRGTAYST